MTLLKESNRIVRDNFNQTRFDLGMRVAGIALLFALIFSFIFLNGRTGEIPVALQDEESLLYVDANTLAILQPCTVDDCSVFTVYHFLGKSLGIALKNTLIPPEPLTMVWFLRFLSFFITLVIVAFYFRALLQQRHIAELDPIREKLFRKIHFTSFVQALNATSTDLWHKLGAIAQMVLKLAVVTIAFVFMTFILASSMSSLLLTTFVALELAPIVIAVLGIIFAASFAYMMVNFISVANTYELLLIGYGIILMGFAWGFRVAELSSINNHWYQNSISNTGIQSSSGLIFTVTMIGMGTFLWLVWNDIALILESIFNNADLLNTPLATRTSDLATFYTINRLLVAAFIMIAGIGLIPTIPNARIFFIPLNVIHTILAFVGPGLLIVAGKGGLTYTARHILPRRFGELTIGLIISDIVALAFFILFYLSKAQIGINTTAFELWILGSVAFWFYGLTVNILDIIEGIEVDEVIQDRVEAELHAIQIAVRGQDTNRELEQDSPWIAINLRGEIERTEPQRHKFDVGTIPPPSRYVQMQQRILPSKHNRQKPQPPTLDKQPTTS